MGKFKTTLVCCLSVAMLAGCGGKSDSEESNKIKIGSNYELTGEVAEYGQASVNGIKLAVKEINAKGGIDGKKIDLISLDNKSTSDEAISIATRLATEDEVTAMMGPATSGNFKAAVSIANEYKVPVVSASATDDAATLNKDGSTAKFGFKTCFSDTVQGTVGANKANELGKTKAIIYKDSKSEYAKGLAKAFATKFESLGGTIVQEEAYVAGDTEFSSIITKIKDKDFDVLYIPGYYNEVGKIIKDARTAGIKQTIIGADGFDAPGLVDKAGKEALNDVYFTTHFSTKEDDKLVSSFVESYKKEYKEQPGAFAALGYDMVYFLKDGIEKAGSTKPADVAKQLAKTKGFKGVTGKFSIDKTHAPVKTIKFIELVNGEQTNIQNVQP
ncbi:MAG: ABC transporter substrate-binding protein [Erysipelotrichaceae bacterium]